MVLDDQEFVAADYSGRNCHKALLRKQTTNSGRTDGRTEEKNGERVSPGKWDRTLSPLPRIDLLLPGFYYQRWPESDERLWSWLL